MKNAIIIHGVDDTRDDVLSYKDSLSNAHWFPWVQKKLIGKDILAQTPEMPKPWLADMDYDEWAAVLGQFDLNEDTILIGHSAGAGFLLKYLSKNMPKKIGRFF
jgi:predicted alpha/beta hydrolase family esterase